MSRPLLLAILTLFVLGPAQARALNAAAAKVDITPDLKSERIWLAGFGAKGRRPSGVHDPLYARIVLLHDGEKMVALVGLDLLGFYINDTDALRRGWAGDDAGKSLFLHATHTHSGPDTLGLWGPMIGRSGINQRYMARIKARIIEALRLLESQLKPATASAGSGSLDPRGLCRDLRDPQIIDSNLSVIRLTSAGGKALATIVNWSCHPEVIGRENTLITADYPGPLCARIEEKTGGQCLFLNGVIGGLMSPDAKAENFYESARIGAAVADAALALKTRPGGKTLAYRFERPLVPVENSRYLLFLHALTEGHTLRTADGAAIAAWRAWPLSLRHLLLGLPGSARPWIETEVSVLDVGPARLLGMPSEVFPELAIGGYDGKYAFGRPLVAAGGPERDIKSAPQGPYLRDLIKAPVRMIVGLANDELGYLVPNYDFKARPGKFMLPRWPGHYEETNSIGPSATKTLTDSAARLLAQPRP
ncbi:MAG: hypothetical protein COV48_00160 [Elusimicrobia bacterium CG11_big_fil_rev_8_21_14_0_20_64_6]|nr:MAG: hypothetical protein COV48_00160 [Elusimicrobia bacterium CG11_big_fil_rev_8_21_14_0_20_64_6]